jgi:hypothetical protein
MNSGNFQGRVHFGNLGVDGRMILKYNFRYSGWEKLCSTKCSQGRLNEMEI